MKPLVLYRSYLGATKRYAWWLKQSLQADAVSFTHYSRVDLDKYDTVIVSAGAYAGRDQVSGFLQRNWDRLHTKRVVVLAVGTPRKKQENRLEFGDLPPEIRSKVAFIESTNTSFDQVVNQLQAS